MAEKKQADRRIRSLLARLQKTYPDARCALNFSNPLELLIATILSAQCTDERVNQVTATLFKKYRTAADYAQAPLDELERDIHSTGFYRNKAKSIKAATQRIVEEFGGQVPRTMDELLTLSGVARKTANVVMGNAFGIPTGVVVDTHVTRLAQRLGLTQQSNPDKIEQELMQILPQAEWINFSHRLIQHGRQICKARKPLCAACVLADLCPSRGDFLG